MNVQRPRNKCARQNKIIEEDTEKAKKMPQLITNKHDDGRELIN